MLRRQVRAEPVRNQSALPSCFRVRRMRSLRPRTEVRCRGRTRELCRGPAFLSLAGMAIGSDTSGAGRRSISLIPSVSRCQLGLSKNRLKYHKHDRERRRKLVERSVCPVSCRSFWQGFAFYFLLSFRQPNTLRRVRRLRCVMPTPLAHRATRTFTSATAKPPWRMPAV